MTTELTQCGEMLIYQASNDGVTVEVRLDDAILSVGYRVNSKQGTQFRIWANQVLKDYLTSSRY